MTKKERKRKKKIQLKNKKLIKKYYWLLPRNVWTDKVPKDYDYTYIEWGVSPGWDKAFGDMLMKELGEAINKYNIKNFRILQIKEKFGEFRLYCNRYNEEIHHIIDKYTYLSQNICILCGAPDVPMINTGWISPYCFNCFLNFSYNKNKSKEEIKEMYEKAIDEKPDENGNFLMASSYTIRDFKDDNKITYDISETANLIRKNYNRRIKYGN